MDTKFETWWKEHAEQLFPYRKVEVLQRYLSDAGMMHLNVPIALTPTEAAWHGVKAAWISLHNGICSHYVNKFFYLNLVKVVCPDHDSKKKFNPS